MPALPRLWMVVSLAMVFVGPMGRARAQLAGADQKEFAQAEQAILDLYKAGKLFDRDQVIAVRRALAQLFEAAHREKIDAAFGEDKKAIEEWFAKKPDIKDKLFTAIDETKDTIDAALKIYREIWSKFPKHRESHHELAIAVSVVWDNPKGVYDYLGHQRRTKSTLPSTNRVGALENFQYLVEHDKENDGRARNLPWEFLIFVVDHRTPMEERGWAQQYYQKHRAAKSWHQAVPYDYEMLKTEQTGSGRGPKLTDKEYSLKNLLTYGGVCTNQADFACRVAKSVGIPAVYCTGMSAYRGGHAWWMYASVVKASPLQVTVGSDGRYQGFLKDAFYTGDVIDPQSGERILDRDMERRLQLVASDRLGKRMVSMLMQVAPMLKDRLKWKPADRIAFLDKCLKICPQAEEPWVDFAQMVKDNEITAEEKKVVRSHLADAMKHFSKHPDFLQRLYGDLLSVYSAEEKSKAYSAALSHFEKMNRADLACDGRLKMTEFLVEQEKWKAASDGLFSSLSKFPTEGRYVPKLARKLEEISGNVKGSKQKIGALYFDLVPKLAKYYGKDEQTVTLQMLEQAVAFMEANGMQMQASALRSRVPVTRKTK